MMSEESPVAESEDDCLEDNDESIKELEKLLQELRKKKQDQEDKSIDDTIDDLKKLLDEVDVEEEKYEDAFEELCNEQKRIEKFKEYTEPDLENILGNSGVGAVLAIVRDKVCRVDELEDELEKMKGRIPTADVSNDHDRWTRGSVSQFESEFNEAQEEFDISKSKLEILKNISSAIRTRHKKMDAAAKVVVDIGHANPATAYWLLTEKEVQDKRGNILITADEFFSGMKSPVVYKVEDWKKEVTVAWAKFQTAREDLNKKEREFNAEQQKLKEAETELAQLKKSIYQTILEGLKTWDKDRLNPNE